MARQHDPYQPAAPLLPAPDSGAVERFQSFYNERFGMWLEEDVARSTLAGLMRFVHLRDMAAAEDAALEGKPLETEVREVRDVGKKLPE